MNLQFPEHKCGLYLTHNQHFDDYMTAEAWIIDSVASGVKWKNDEAIERAKATNEIWQLQWYPDTPVAFIWMAAPTLEELLTLANETLTCS